MKTASYTEVVKILLEHGADISVKDNSGKTALECARLNEADGTVEMLEDFM